MTEDLRGTTLPPRRRPWWGIAVALLVAALICWVALLASLINGYPWDDRSLVPTDGQPHTVELKANTRAMMWAHEMTVTPTCTAADAATGAALPLSLVTDVYRRAGGMVGGKWVGIVTFPTQSGSVDVTCDDGGETAPGVDWAGVAAS